MALFMSPKKPGADKAKTLWTINVKKRNHGFSFKLAILPFIHSNSGFKARYTKYIFELGDKNVTDDMLDHST